MSVINLYNVFYTIGEKSNELGRNYLRPRALPLVCCIAMRAVWRVCLCMAGAGTHSQLWFGQPAHQGESVPLLLILALACLFNFPRSLVRHSLAELNFSNYIISSSSVFFIVGSLYYLWNKYHQNRNPRNLSLLSIPIIYFACFSLFAFCGSSSSVFPSFSVFRSGVLPISSIHSLQATALEARYVENWCNHTRISFFKKVLWCNHFWRWYIYWLYWKYSSLCSSWAAQPGLCKSVSRTC